jgi:hypothetical protein
MERLLARPMIRARFPLRNPMAVPFYVVYENLLRHPRFTPGVVK